MDSGLIHISLASDDRYGRYAGAVIASILKNAAPDERLFFHILDSGISAETKEKICSLKGLHSGAECRFYSVRAEEILPQASLPEYISRTAMARLELPQILPDIEQIIYFDCDIIVMDSLKELWEYPLTAEQVIAGAPDFGRTLAAHCGTLGLSAEQYINSGVLKMDLKKMRDLHSGELFVRTLERYARQITMGDQDLINLTFCGKIARLPQRWNLHKAVFKALAQQELSAAAEKPGALHFTGARKPWHYGAIRHPFRREYFKAVSGTVFAEPWKDFINTYFLWADRKCYKIPERG